MKIKHILSVIGISGVLLLGSSCTKYLNLSPENSTYDEVFWTDGANVEKATLGAYALLRDAVRNERSYFIFGDIASGVLKAGGDYWNYASLSKSGGFKFSYAPYLEPSLWDWTRFYKIINQCNLIIEHTTAMDVSLFDNGEDEKNQYIANAKFLRAYTYFYMQRVWGDVLLVKETFKDPQNIPDMARSPQTETLAFCKADLAFAATNLGQGSVKSFASKGAANALLAEIYAWEHDYINTEKYIAEALKGGYALEDIKDYRKIWQGDSKESIFELNMLYSETGREWTTDFFNVFLTSTNVEGKGIGSIWEIDPEFLESDFKDGSVRFDSITAPFPDNDLQRVIRKYDRVEKYNPNDKSLYAVSNNLVLMRLADLILLRAEAEFKNGKEVLALDDLNMIRNRAGLTDTVLSGNDLFIEIFKERRRELIGEGTIQFDLIRMNLFKQLDEYSSYYDDERLSKQGYYWPLNMRTLLPQNESLTQNPYWMNH
ncbi:RagB/SusD family nutrient uptake outer membrane protein [Sphingobacterium sp. SRCM116780]|uniref:RagB/SusD family nutrient uptake outer membrane protein n=1 Tax=Sphingobacterium sp. SRCM116780 TaxID=2907623 RepID=UPI001F1BDBE0|nr:RagB/SusD family nutrient uptake outer membrane protein [Sphingobacterium sp. SRCM116780]UIR56068.1 RagB/SusD family nutrient uptake outer membrane protein [Sphingobacterium sp. SRCM116780]